MQINKDIEGFLRLVRGETDRSDFRKAIEDYGHSRWSEGYDKGYADAADEAYYAMAGDDL